MLCATYPQAIGYNLGMCNDEIDRHLKEISQTDEQMDGVLKGRTERSDVHNGMWPLQYEFNLKSLTLPTHFNPKLT